MMDVRTEEHSVDGEVTAKEIVESLHEEGEEHSVHGDVMANERVESLHPEGERRASNTEFDDLIDQFCLVATTCW
jgi:hypothetical protein